MSYTSGQGYVVLDYAVTVLLWLAVLLQVAVLRDRSICETHFALSCRWLVTAGVAGIALRFSFVLSESGDVQLPPFSLASLAVLAVGLIGRPLELLMTPKRHRRHSDLWRPDDEHVGTGGGW
jgi:hypothetical protein